VGGAVVAGSVVPGCAGDVVSGAAVGETVGEAPAGCSPGDPFVAGVPSPVAAVAGVVGAAVETLPEDDPAGTWDAVGAAGAADLFETRTLAAMRSQSGRTISKWGPRAAQRN